MTRILKERNRATPCPLPRKALKWHVLRCSKRRESWSPVFNASPPTAGLTS